MKFSTTIALLVASLSHLTGFTQLNNGGLYANFGGDAATRSNYMKHGLVTGTVSSDDWFSPISGSSVIDTTSAASYLSLLQACSNISFTKSTSLPLYTQLNGKISLDTHS